MSYRDLLFPLLTYPDATPPEAIAAGVQLAKRLGGSMTGLAIEVDIPAVGNRLANALVNFDGLARDEERRSVVRAGELLKSLSAAALETGVTAMTTAGRAGLYLEAELVCGHARTHDLSLVGVGQATPAGRGLAEAVLFGSGRPVVVFPQSAPLGPNASFETVAVAWDGSRAASRALADALPILESAAEVRVLTVSGDKEGVDHHTADPVLRHLKAHGVHAVVDDVALSGRRIGELIAAYVAERNVDLLVMGGFGHARLKEFVLGGATDSILDHPPCPVLLSH